MESLNYTTYFIMIDRWEIAQAITGGCCQWRGSDSYDNEEHIETFVLREKFSGEIATEQQPTNVIANAKKRQ